MLDGVKAGSDQNLDAPAMYRIVGEYLGVIAIIFLIREVLQVVRRYLVENACTRITKDMTVKVIGHLMMAEFSTLTQEKIGALQGRVGRAVHGFVRFIRLAFLDFFPPLCMGLFALIATISKQPILAGVMACVIPASLYLTLRQIRSQRGIRLQLIRSPDEMDGAIVEQLAGLEYVRAADMYDHEVARIADAAERRRAMENRHHFQMSLFGSAKSLNEAFFHILVLALAAYLAIEGDISFGDVLTFSLLFANVMAPLAEVHRGLDEGHECSLLVAELLHMLDEPLDPSFSPLEPKEPSPVPAQPIVEVEDLVVEYSAENARKRALKGVSLAIRHGETIGLAGPSGCGKTTWLKVLLRLTHPTSGRITLGGVPLESVSRAAIGKLIGYVSQSPFVFAGTVEDNIRYGSPHADPMAIQEAAIRACIHDEILQMPGGYQFNIRERGLNLSAGQRQRLALARVFLKDSPILILDEGTSALDTISERYIQSAIDLARKDRTVIMVAHRLTTLLDADRIYVFQDGHVVEIGTYAELYGRGGFFRHLVECAESSKVVSA
jgi:ATP-binding cassette subfamily B protein